MVCVRACVRACLVGACIYIFIYNVCVYMRLYAFVPIYVSSIIWCIFKKVYRCHVTNRAVKIGSLLINTHTRNVCVCACVSGEDRPCFLKPWNVHQVLFLTTTPIDTAFGLCSKSTDVQCKFIVYCVKTVTIVLQIPL